MADLKEPISLALTGASGAQYGLRLLEMLVVLLVQHMQHIFKIKMWKENFK